MLTTSTLYEALERRRTELGLSQSEVGRRAFGRSDSSPLQNIKRGSSPTWENLTALCSALGLVIRIDPKEVLVAGLEEPGSPTDLTISHPLRAGYLPVPWHEFGKRRASAPVAFHGDWLTAQGLNAEHLRAVVPDKLQIDIASAADTVALLDTTAAQKGASGLWCYKEGGIMTIGRAAFFDQSIVLFSDGHRDDPVRLITKSSPQDFALLGRAVWLGVLPRP